MSAEENFKKKCPGSYFLDSENVGELEIYLRKHNWLGLDEGITQIEKAGEGNMNLTLRVTAGDRTFIIKQARPWVEKYPQLEAPVERILIEAKFYEIISSNKKLQELTPEIIGKDEHSFFLVMEDLGASNDFTDIYQPDKQLKDGELKTLMEFLNELHGNFSLSKTGKNITNPDMRKLNHEHIFIYPFLNDNGLNLNDIEPGLEDVAANFKNDPHLKMLSSRLGEKYLMNGEYLLQGDYYPGSWLRTPNGVRVIDPEFGFSGPREFELGVMLAHMKMAEQLPKIQNQILSLYHYTDELEQGLLNQFIGIELMRRIMGLAQLPLSISIEKKKELLEEAFDLITKSSVGIQ